jgi:hypothetical protein
MFCRLYNRSGEIFRRILRRVYWESWLSIQNKVRTRRTKIIGTRRALSLHEFLMNLLMKTIILFLADIGSLVTFKFFAIGARKIHLVNMLIIAKNTSNTSERLGFLASHVIFVGAGESDNFAG